MSDAVEFFVPGVPAPGGSKRVFPIGQGKFAVTDDSKRSKPWRAVVQLAAREHYRAAPLQGPLYLTVIFYMPRPKSHKNAHGVVRAAAPPFPAVKPDATKLLRCLEDACSGILWNDDAQVVMQHVSKRYAVDAPGALVRVGVAATEA
jgi:Holliday junction resolvase RusA-like endonuclease